MATHWTCPYCNRDQVVVDKQHGIVSGSFYLESSKYKLPTIICEAFTCSNPECNDLQINVVFGEDCSKIEGTRITNVVNLCRVRPNSSALPRREYVPEVIYEDYSEASLIKDLSPKAAATLVRRCLQGMIRDFCNIRGRTLDQEIKSLAAMVAEDKAPPGVSQESVEAIDHVRGIGNIGAHMEKDINLIIGVEPEEVDALVGLTEMLFEEWYGNRDRRKRKLEQVRAVASAKREARSAGKAGEPEEPGDPS